MQGFYYNYIKNKYGDIAEMLLTDTDSLMYNTETENIYEVFYEDKKLFDFSNYPKYSKCYNNANSLVLGKNKDETCDVPIKSKKPINS